MYLNEGMGQSNVKSTNFVVIWSELIEAGKNIIFAIKRLMYAHHRIVAGWRLRSYTNNNRLKHS
jgi:hypothetical protein